MLNISCHIRVEHPVVRGAIESDTIVGHPVVKGGGGSRNNKERWQIRNMIAAARKEEVVVVRGGGIEGGCRDWVKGAEKFPIG